MKRIIFMRHGQAEDYTPDFSDFERSLTRKGKKVTRSISSLVRDKISDPGVLISSPAFRAIETALIFAEVYNIPADRIILYPDLYFRIDEKSFMQMLRLVKEETDTVTLFGHNPDFTDLANYFCNQAGDVIPKSGIVSLVFETKLWSGITASSGNLEIFMKPKSIL